MANAVLCTAELNLAAIIGNFTGYIEWFIADCVVLKFTRFSSLSPPPFFTFHSLSCKKKGGKTVFTKNKNFNLLIF